MCPYIRLEFCLLTDRHTQRLQRKYNPSTILWRCIKRRSRSIPLTLTCDLDLTLTCHLFYCNLEPGMMMSVGIIFCEIWPFVYFLWPLALTFVCDLQQKVTNFKMVRVGAVSMRSVGILSTDGQTDRHIHTQTNNDYITPPRFRGGVIRVTVWVTVTPFILYCLSVCPTVMTYLVYYWSGFDELG